MKFTSKQLIDLEIAEYFIPWNNLFKIEITDEDRKMFLENSEQGKHKDKVKQSHFNDGFNYLLQGKRWRGITIHELWEQGILEGSTPYFTLLGGENIEEVPPRNVLNFIKGEIFKGKDAELIESIYQQVLTKWISKLHILEGWVKP